MSTPHAADIPLRPRLGLRGVALGTAGMAALLLLVPLVGSAAPAPYPPTTGGAPVWTNGMVLCQFNASAPSVVVSATNLSGTGLTISDLTVSEVDPAGATVAVAATAGLVWNATDLSWSDAYAEGYTIAATISAGSGGPAAEPVGSVDLGVEFLLPESGGLPLGPIDQVQVAISVDDWSWQEAGDHLVLTFGVGASFPTAEHLAAASGDGWLVASVANSSGAELDEVGANPNATAASASHGSSSIVASPSLADLTPRSAQVSVDLSSSAGSFTSLAYTARVGVVLPSTVAGIPLADLAAVGVAAGLVSVAVALTTGRLRGRPSKLIYVDEEASP